MSGALSSAVRRAAWISPARDAVCERSQPSACAISAAAAGTLRVEELSRLQVFLWVYLAAWALLAFWTLPALVARASVISAASLKS